MNSETKARKMEVCIGLLTILLKFNSQPHYNHQPAPLFLLISEFCTGKKTKVKDFTKKINTEAGAFEFHFQGIYTVKGIRFLVSVRDRNSRSHRLTMEMEKGIWKIQDGPNLPQWVRDSEGELAQAIRDSHSFL